MSGDTVAEKIEVIDEFSYGPHNYRLVHMGAGPDQLQIQTETGWVKERSCYEWYVLIGRVKILNSRLHSEKEEAKRLSGENENLLTTIRAHEETIAQLQEDLREEEAYSQRLWENQ